MTCKVVDITPREETCSWMFYNYHLQRNPTVFLRLDLGNNLHHSVLQVITILSNGADVFSQTVCRIDPGLPYGVTAQVLAGEFTERTIFPGYNLWENTWCVSNLDLSYRCHHNEKGQTVSVYYMRNSVAYQRLGSIVCDELVIVKRDRLVPTLAAGWVVSSQDSLERFPELCVEYGVDDRVEGWIGVSQPCKDLEGDVWDAGLAESCHYVDAEEWYPADQEHTHYYAWNLVCGVVQQNN